MFTKYRNKFDKSIILFTDGMTMKYNKKTFFQYSFENVVIRFNNKTLLFFFLRNNNDLLLFLFICQMEKILV